jgi:hypothetical protein
VTSITASGPSRESARVRTTVLEVAWVPAPTISFSFPLQRSSARRVSSSTSSRASAGASPVVPPITIPSVPSLT